MPAPAPPPPVTGAAKTLEEAEQAYSSRELEKAKNAVPEDIGTDG